MSEIKKMDLFQAVAMIFSGMVGSGVLFLPNQMAHCQSWGIFSWCLGSLMGYCIFLSFVGVNDYITENIGNKVPCMLDFLRLGYRENIVFLLVFGHFVAMSMTSAVAALSFSDYFVGLFPEYGCWCGRTLSTIVLLLVFLLNIISFGAANSVNFLLSLLKLAFFLLISILGVSRASTYTPTFGPPTLLFNGAAISMFAFLGIEFGIFAAGSIENPKENVIKSTKIGLVFSSFIFIGIFSACLFVLPDLSKTKTPVYDCAIRLTGSLGGRIVGFIALASCLTGLNGRLVIQGNCLRDFAKKKFVSKIFGAQTAQGFPWVGSFFSLFISFAMIWNPFQVDMTLFIVTLVAFLYCSIVMLNILLNGISIRSLLAVLSCCLMLYNINLIVILAVAVVYFIGYILKTINDRCSKSLKT